MKQTDHQASKKVYHVHVGHFQLKLVCRDEAEAIRLARRRLRDEFPRLWDVVQNLRDERFRIRIA